jgi:hypothetical protein
MSDPKIRLSEEEIGQIRERVLRVALAREESLQPGTDVEALARVASNAYWLATRKGESLAQAESRALLALSAVD